MSIHQYINYRDPKFIAAAVAAALQAIKYIVGVVRPDWKQHIDELVNMLSFVFVTVAVSLFGLQPVENKPQTRAIGPITQAWPAYAWVLLPFAGLVALLLQVTRSFWDTPEEHAAE